MILKRLYKPLIKSYEQLNFSQKSETPKFWSSIPRGKRLGNFITGRGFQSLRNIAIFPKNVIKNQRLQVQNLEKYKESKNVPKKPLGAFSQEI